MEPHRIVAQPEWLEARRQLLQREKELTRLQDEVSAARRQLPWVPVAKAYMFDAPEGRVSLADLFAGRSQLIVKHFMFAPDWSEGCVGCSFSADHIDGIRPHLEQKDVAFVAVSRAPLAKIEAFRKRMGWHFGWVSSQGSDFNFDFHVSFTPSQVASGHIDYNYQRQDWATDELPGVSVFARDDQGAIFHTYSTYARGSEAFIGTYRYLDILPKGREENGGNLGSWVRHHDRYERKPAEVDCCAGQKGT